MYEESWFSRRTQGKVKAVLMEAITSLWKNILTYRVQLLVRGLLGTTLDNDKVFLIAINEIIRGDFAGGEGVTPRLLKAIPLMMLQREHMTAQGKPMGREQGMYAGRGRAPLVNIK